MLDGTFPEDSRTAEVVPGYKKKKRTDKNNGSPVSILSNIVKFTKGSSAVKCMTILTAFFQNTNADLGKGTVLSTVSFI